MQSTNPSPKNLPDGFMITKHKHSTYENMKRYHSHSYYEILHIVHGTRLVDIETNLYHLSDLGVGFFKPGTNHSTSMEKKTYHERYIINLSEETLTMFTDFFNINKDDLFCCNVKNYTILQKKEIDRLFDIILLESKNNIPLKQNTKLLLYISQLLIELQNGTPAPNYEKDKSLTYNISNYISQNFTKHITLSFLSETFFINKSQLCRTIKNTYGKTFSELLMELRLEHAMNLLTTTTIPITEISIECGYSNYTYFISQFKKATNTTPSEFRKSHKNNII